MANSMIRYTKRTQSLQTSSARTYIITPLRKAVSLSAIFFVLVLAGTSCKKPSQNIGLEIQPPTDALGFITVDTFSITSYIAIDDSIRTSNLSTGTSMLGSYHDPVFGITSAGIFTQPLLSTSNVDFTPAGGSLSDIVVDSLVLSLVFDASGYYGDQFDQRLKVHRVTNDFYGDSTYYSFDTVTYDAFNDLVASEPYIWSPEPNDSVMVNGEMVRPMLRVQLDKSLGYEFVNQSGMSTMLDNDQTTGFLSLLKGLYIVPDNGLQPTGRGGVFYFDMLDPETKLTLYYHANVIPDSHDDGGWPIGYESATYDFTITSASATFTHVKHDYTGTAIEAQLADSTLGQQDLFVQAGGGIRTVIQIPNLINLIDSGMVGINRAELIVPVKSSSTTNFAPFERLALQALNDQGEEEIILDEFMSGDLNVGGFHDIVEEEYRLVFTRQLVNILTGDKDNYGFVLLATAAGVTVNRVELNGPQSVMENMKVVVSYTQYEQ